MCVWDESWIFLLFFVLQVSRWNSVTVSWYSVCTSQKSVKCHCLINIYGKWQDTGVESPYVKPWFHDCRIWQMRLQLCLVRGARCTIIILFPQLAYLINIHTLVHTPNLRFSERRCWILSPSAVWRRWPCGVCHIWEFPTPVHLTFTKCVYSCTDLRRKFCLHVNTKQNVLMKIFSGVSGFGVHLKRHVQH